MGLNTFLEKWDGLPNTHGLLLLATEGTENTNIHTHLKNKTNSARNS